MILCELLTDAKHDKKNKVNLSGLFRTLFNVLTDNSLVDDGRSQGFFCKHSSTKYRNASVHSEDCKLGVSFCAIW